MKKFSLRFLVYVERNTLYIISFAEGTLYLRNIKINDSQDWD